MRVAIAIYPSGFFLDGARFILVLKRSASGPRRSDYNLSDVMILREPCRALDGFSHAPIKWARAAGITFGTVVEITLSRSAITAMYNDGNVAFGWNDILR